MAMVNPITLHRSVLNLVLNAADAVEGRGIIEVRLSASGPQAVLEVHDNGPGIPEDQRRRIFEAFYTTKAMGTGLGLLSVKACADEHHGHVEVLSSPLGGALFRLTLPLAPKPTPVSTA
jgi:signal transduction histidine kinase